MTQNLGNLFIDGEGTIKDSSGSNHTITAYGEAAVSTVEKKFGNSSVHFDGTGDYILSPDADDWNFANGNFTIDLWVNFSSLGGRRSLINTQVDQEQDGFNFVVDHTNLEFITNGVDGNIRIHYFNLPMAGNITTGIWHHIAVVRNNNTLKLFLNGVEKRSEVLDYELLHNSAMVLRIGEGLTWSGTNPAYWNDAYIHDFNGYMDNIRLVKGTALWTEDFELTEEALFYKDDNAYIRPDNISGLYNTGSRGNLRGKASEGFIRPTLKQFFTSKDFEDIDSYRSPTGIKSFTNNTAFNSSYTKSTDVIKISDTVSCWARTLHSNAAYVSLNIFDDTNNTLTDSTAILLATGVNDFVKLLKIDDTHILISFIDSDYGGRGKVVIGTIEDGVMTLGSIYTLTTSIEVEKIDVVKVDDNKVCFLYEELKEDGCDIKSRVASITGTVLSFGSETTIVGNSTGNVTKYSSIIMLDTNKVLVVFAMNLYGTASKIGTIDGNTTSWGNHVQLISTRCSELNGFVISQTKVLLFLMHSNSFSSVILNITDDAVTSSEFTAINSPSTLYSVLNLEQHDDTHFSAVYKSTTDANKLYASILQLASETDLITEIDATYIDTGSSTIILSAAVMNENKILVMCTDSTNSHYAAYNTITLDK